MVVDVATVTAIESPTNSSELAEQKYNKKELPSTVVPISKQTQNLCWNPFSTSQTPQECPGMTKHGLRVLLHSRSDSFSLLPFSICPNCLASLFI